MFSELSNEELRQEANSAKARDVLFRSRFLAGALTDLLADVERTNVVEGGIWLVGKVALARDGGMTLIGRLRSLNTRTGSEVDIWRLDTESGNTIYVEPADPTSEGTERLWSGLMHATGLNRIELGERATRFLAGEIERTIDALEGDKRYQELSNAYAILLKWLRDNIVYFSDADGRSLEMYNLVDWESADSLLELVQALDIIKQNAPDFFIELLGFSLKSTDSKGSYFGNLLQKALANTLRRIGAGSYEEVTNTADLADAHRLVRGSMDQLLTMNRRVALFGRDICEAILVGAQNAIASEPEEKRGAAIAFWTAAAARAAYEASVRREIERARGGKLAEMETKLERLLGITAESVGNPKLVLKLISKAPVALLKRARINARLQEIFGEEALADIVKFQSKCKEQYEEDVRNLARRIPIVITREGDGRIGYNPVFRKYGTVIVPLIHVYNSKALVSQSMISYHADCSATFYKFINNPQKNATKLIESGLKPKDVKYLGDIQWPYMIAEYLLTNPSETVQPAINWARSISGMPELVIDEAEIAKSMLAVRPAPDIFHDDVLDIVKGVESDIKLHPAALKWFIKNFADLLARVEGQGKRDAIYQMVFRHVMASRNWITYLPILAHNDVQASVSKELSEGFVELVRNKFMPAVPTVTLEVSITAQEMSMEEKKVRTDRNPKGRAQAEDTISKLFETASASVVEAVITAPNFKDIIAGNPRKILYEMSISDTIAPYHWEHLESLVEKTELWGEIREVTTEECSELRSFVLFREDNRRRRETISE